MGNRSRCCVPTRPSQPRREANGPSLTGRCLGTIVGSGLREGRHSWKVPMGQERLPGKGCSHGALQGYWCQPGRKRGPRREESCGQQRRDVVRRQEAAGSRRAWGLRAGEGGRLCPAAVGTPLRPLVPAHAYQMGLSLGSPGMLSVDGSGPERKGRATRRLKPWSRGAEGEASVRSFVLMRDVWVRDAAMTLASLHVWPWVSRL